MRQLTLRIALPEAGSYRVSLVASENGDAATETELATAEIAEPFTIPAASKGSAWPSPDELKELLGGDPPDNDRVVPRAGRALAAVLESGKLAAAWKKEFQDAWKRSGNPPQASLRIVFEIAPPELRPLPWELVVPSVGPDPLARRRWTTSSRRHDAALPAAPIGRLTEPLRFLIIIGCEEAGSVQWREELHHLLALTAPRLHAVDFELFITHRIHQGQLFKRLRDTLNDFQPHIVHFIGHGEAATDQSQAALVLYDVTDSDEKNHTSRLWPVDDIVNALSGARPRLVVFNACRSADFAGDAGVYGVAESLLDNGVAAVVGMQGDIPSASAAEFASGFYQSLLGGATIDAAMVEGRNRIGNVSAATDRDWALPVLVSGVPIDEVLPLSAIDDSDSALQVRSFVDRRAQRRALRAGAEAAAHAAGTGLLLVRGESEIGKTTLVKYALEGCSLRGRAVRYVSFEKKPSMHIIDVLRHIRGTPPGGADGPAIERSLYDKFATFNDALVALLQGRIPPEAPGSGEDDPSLSFVEGKAHPRTIELALEAFKRCLRDATTNAPLVIALDELGKPSNGEGISVEYFTGGDLTLAKALLAPIAERRAAVIGDVRCVICASQDDEDVYKLQEISPATVSCDVDLMASEDFDLLAREYLFQVFRSRNLTHDVISGFVDPYGDKFVRRKPYFKPGGFELFAQNVRAWL